MSKTVATNVILVSVNHIDDEKVEEMVSSSDYDTLSDYAESLASNVEAIMAQQFRDADDVPILDVSTEVYDDWNDEDAQEVVAE